MRPGGRTLREEEGKEPVVKAAAGKEIGPGEPELAGGTAAENETPTGFVLVVKRLHGVEDSGDGLGLVDEHDVGGALSRQGAAGTEKRARVCEERAALGGIRQIEGEGGVGQELAKERGLTGLAGAKQDVHIGLAELLSEEGGGPAGMHSALYLYRL